jgi:AraC-like DNA-binding protein
VTKWRARFVARRLEGLADEPRPGAARTITDEQVEQVLVTTLETTPADATHWSTRSLARQLGMSQSAISRIWRAFGLKPHLVDTFKLSTDPQFIDKVRDIGAARVNLSEGGSIRNHCVVAVSSSGSLIQTAPGSAGGSGGLRTKRSGCWAWAASSTRARWARICSARP